MKKENLQEKVAFSAGGVYNPATNVPYLNNQIHQQGYLYSLSASSSDLQITIYDSSTDGSEQPVTSVTQGDFLFDDGKNYYLIKNLKAGGSGGGISELTSTAETILIEDPTGATTNVDVNPAKVSVFGITQVANDHTLLTTDEQIIQVNGTGIVTLPAKTGFTVGKIYTVVNNTNTMVVTINPTTGFNNGNTNLFYLPPFSFGSLNSISFYTDGIDVSWLTTSMTKGCLTRQNTITIASLGDGVTSSQSITLAPQFGTAVTSLYVAKATNTQNALLQIQLQTSSLTGSTWLITNLSNQVVTGISIVIQTEGY